VPESSHVDDHLPDRNEDSHLDTRAGRNTVDVGSRQEFLPRGFPHDDKLAAKVEASRNIAMLSRRVVRLSKPSLGRLTQSRCSHQICGQLPAPPKNWGWTEHRVPN